jgi:hypothetical protein
MTDPETTRKRGQMASPTTTRDADEIRAILAFFRIPCNQRCPGYNLRGTGMYDWVIVACYSCEYTADRPDSYELGQLPEALTDLYKAQMAFRNLELSRKRDFR